MHRIISRDTAIQLLPDAVAHNRLDSFLEIQQTLPETSDGIGLVGIYWKPLSPIMVAKRGNVIAARASWPEETGAPFESTPLAGLRR